MLENNSNPVTLADKLGLAPAKPRSKFLQNIIVLSIVLLLALGALNGSLFEPAEVVIYAIVAILMYIIFLFVMAGLGRFLPFAGASKQHFLFRYDSQNFMPSLKLAQKTALFDGNNVYHFGIKNGMGSKPLISLVAALRAEGYRIVCFFDANIYYTLRENGDLAKSGQRFSRTALHRIFGLAFDEIYVVPSGVQADRFIVESLSHLPISFAVTNDRFRDFEAEYPVLSNDRLWRKGFKFQNNELLLLSHKFPRPLVIK